MKESSAFFSGNFKHVSRNVFFSDSTIDDSAQTESVINACNRYSKVQQQNKESGEKLPRCIRG